MKGKYHIIILLTILSMWVVSCAGQEGTDTEAYQYVISDEDIKLFFKSDSGDFAAINDFGQPGIQILFTQNDLALVSVKGYFDQYKSEDYFCDMGTGKLFLTLQKENRYYVIDNYPFVVGDILKTTDKGEFIIVTDYYYRGGSGGGDNTWFLRIFRIEEDRLVNLFDEQLAYSIDMEAAEFTDKYGYFSLDGKKLYVAILPTSLENTKGEFIEEVDGDMIIPYAHLLTFIYDGHTYYSAGNKEIFKKLRKSF